MNELLPLSKYLPPERDDKQFVTESLIRDLKDEADNLSADAYFVLEHLIQHYQKTCTYEDLFELIRNQPDSKKKYKKNYIKHRLGAVIGEIKDTLAIRLKERNCYITTIHGHGFSLCYKQSH